ncbi:pyridoxal phosphate-dependent transferase [Aspergillus germanicus]
MPSDAANDFWTKASRSLLKTSVPFSPAVIVKALGTRLYDIEGNQILDFTSGQMSSLLGHSHPEIVKVIQKSAGELDHLPSNMISPPVVDLGERLRRILPRPLEKSFFLNTGGESVEAAIKLAKCYTGKFEIIAFSASYHGLTQGVVSATYSAGRKFGGPVMPGQSAFPAPYAYRSPFRHAGGSYDWETEMEYGWSLIDRQTVGSLAAFVMEPILSTGGVLELPKGYLTKMSIECKKRGFVPDILCLSKTLGCGLPLSSISTTAAIEHGANAAGFMWLTTHSNDPMPAAIGDKVLEIVERDGFCERAAERGEQLSQGLLRLQKEYWGIGDVRGRGLLQGIEIISDVETKASGSALGQAVSERALSKGLSCNIITYPRMGDVFRLAPPVTVTAAEIEEGLEILNEAFAYVLNERGVRN